MDNAIVQRDLTPSIWEMIWNMAPVMHRSRLFGVSSPEAAAAIMLKGYELGLSITASFEFVQIVQGKPSLAPRGALALLHNSPEITTLQINRLTNEQGAFTGYACHMARRNGFAYTATYTLDDARRAGLVKPDSGWANYPENMCLWRAVGFCADVVAPDITAGMTTLMKMPEQLGLAITQGGDIIDATPPLATELPNAPTLTISLTMDELLARYGAEAILVANEGRLPGTDSELNAIAMKLAVV